MCHVCNSSIILWMGVALFNIYKNGFVVYSDYFPEVAMMKGKIEAFSGGTTGVCYGGVKRLITFLVGV